LAVCNEALAEKMPRVPLVLTRARVATLTADQPFDVAPLLAQSVDLDAALERDMPETIADYRARGLLAGSELLGAVPNAGSGHTAH
jgi:hypothetical protein